MPVKNFEDSWTVTMFSYTNELLDGAKTPNQLLDDLLTSGVTKVVELDGPQHFRNYPDVGLDELQATKNILSRHQARVSLLGIYADRVLSSTRVVDSDTVVENMRKQIRIAHELGAPGARIMVGGLTSEELMKLVPLAEELKVAIVFEVQGSATPDSKPAQDCLELVRSANSDYVGIVFDSSLFMVELPKALLDSMIRSGIDVADVEEIAKRWKSEPVEEFREWLNGQIESKKISPAINSFLMTLFTRMGHSQPNEWKEFLPFVKFVHLKYWELSDESGKISQPTSRIDAFLSEANYQGFYTAEWGGHEWGDLPDCNAMKAITYLKQIVEPILSSR